MAALWIGLGILVSQSPRSAAADAPELRITTGLTGPTERIAEAGKGTGTRIELGKSPLLGLALSHRWGKLVSGLLDVTIAPLHPYAFNACLFRGITGRCDFPVTPETGDAQTYKYVLGLEVWPGNWRARPFVGADVGGITYTYFAFDRRHRDTRLLWSLRGGLLVRVGRHGLVAEVRRSTVSNPPWGLVPFHPLELRIGVQLSPGHAAD